MAEQPAGLHLDGLGITFDLDDGDLVESALVLSKVVQADGTVSLHIAHSDGLSWIDRLGLLTAAQHVSQQMSIESGDD